jgi:predicted deacylase
MDELFQIGTARVAAGERSTGYVLVSKKADGTDISIPVILVRGKTDGPALLVNGGIHGDEFAGMEAIIRLSQELDPDQLKGTFVGVPAVNVQAFAEGDRVNHYDYLDLNRTFPGAADGSLTKQIADTFLNEVICKCDGMVDLHGGGGKFEIRPVVVAQGAYKELIWDMALATGFDLVWLGGPWGGTGRISALQAGVPAITVEAGGTAECRESDVEVHLAAIKGVMKHFGMLDGKPEPAPSYQVVSGGMTYARHGGFVHPIAQLGQQVRVGQLLARSTDLYGNLVEEIRSPFDGIVVEMRRLPSLQPGDIVCILGKPEPVP